MSRVSDLLARARAATGLHDFGDDSFREGLEILVSSADRQARLHERGRAAFEGQIVDLLGWRLQVEDWYARHPEIDEQEITAPLIGVGLPRTGSTAMGCLLGEDPEVRSLRTWESQYPCPPPEKATEHTDPRIARSQAAFEVRDRTWPRLRQMVPSAPTSPNECQLILAQEFRSQLFLPMAHVPDYAHWLYYEADMVPTYRYLKRVLKMLQWRCPPTSWQLKSPAHMLFMPALVQVFPDARFWMTHRDITAVIPSAVDLYYEIGRAMSDHVDLGYIRWLNEDTWDTGLHRLVAWRDAGNDHLFFDAHFGPFQKDPVPVIAELYRFLGKTLSEEARQRMEAWRRDTPRDKHGRHTVTPSELGIDLGEVRRRFAFYSERFNVAQEG